MNERFKIAIIEDSPVLRDMLTELLEEIENVDVTVTAGSQKSALEALQSCHVDLAIVDLELKAGNGLGVVQKLQNEPEKFGSPKTVVFSNYAISPMSRRCRELGVDRIYDKSFQLTELLTYIKDEIGQLQFN